MRHSRETLKPNSLLQRGRHHRKCISWHCHCEGLPAGLEELLLFRKKYYGIALTLDEHEIGGVTRRLCFKAA